MRLVAVEWIDDSEAVLTVEENAGCLAFLFQKTWTRRYRGRGTIWRDAETGARCPTSLEGELADLWHRARWARKETL